MNVPSTQWRLLGLFGEMALIESEPRALTAVADTDAELVEIRARQFWVLVHETPRLRIS